MRLPLFTGGAEIEVFANTALVSGSNNWKHVTSAALHLLMNDIADLLLVYLIAIEELLQNLTALLFQLLFNQSFEHFSGHALFASVYFFVHLFF
jgi:hypothetical protein